MTEEQQTETITREQIAQLVAEDKRQRETACTQEVNAALQQIGMKYDCVVVPIISVIGDGQTAIAQLRIMAR